MSSLRESAKSISDISEQSSSWKLSQADGIVPPKEFASNEEDTSNDNINSEDNKKEIKEENTESNDNNIKKDIKENDDDDEKNMDIDNVQEDNKDDIKEEANKENNDNEDDIKKETNEENDDNNKNDNEEYSEEEEEEEELEFEIKLNTDVEPDKKPQNFFHQPISLQQPGQVSQVQQGLGQNLVPTPSQTGANIYDAEYLDGDRPWNKPGADITDYFNYGFTEKTWEAYRQKQTKKRAAQNMQEKISVYEASKEDSSVIIPTMIKEEPRTIKEPSHYTPSNSIDRLSQSPSISSPYHSTPDSRSSRGRRVRDETMGHLSYGEEINITPTEPPPSWPYREEIPDSRYPPRLPSRSSRHHSDRHERDDRRLIPRDYRDDYRRDYRDDRSRREYKERLSGRKREYLPKSESERKRSRYH